MIFAKTKAYNKYRFPIDCYKNAWDKKRIFGDNKTWIGFFSMIFFCTLFQLIHGILCNWLNINQYNDLYKINENTLLLNVIFGFLIGMAYMLCELPNSFIKRRIGISSGKTDKGIKGVTFFIVDQIDSLIGVMFVLYLFSNFTMWKYIGYVALGAITHIAINLTLYFAKVRKNV